MTPRGIAEVEKANTPHFPVTHNTTNINAPNLGNIQTGGHGNSQTISVNPDFDKAINSLLQLVQSSSLNACDKKELIDEVVKVNTLALKEGKPGVLDKIKSRMEIIKVGLTSAGLIAKAHPYLNSIWHYFKSQYNL